MLIVLRLDDIAQGRQGFVDGLGLLHLLARDFALLQPFRASGRTQRMPIQCSHDDMALP